MNIPRFSIQRPIFTTMVTLIAVILGAIALVRLPIDLMPDITDPTISVRTEYENASPEVVEELVTRPIEEAMAAVPGAEEVSSTSSEGISNVTVKFSWGTNIDAATSDVRDRIDRIMNRLPDDVDRPTLFKFDFAAMPIIFMGVSSELDPVEMRALLDDQVKFRIESIDGVASINFFGGREREISVDIDPYRLRALGVPLNLVMAILKRANLNRPAGYVDSGNLEVTIRAPGEYASVREIRETVVMTKDGVPIRVGDIANVHDGMNRVRRVSRIDMMDGIRSAVMKQSGSNTVDVAGRVVEEIERLKQDYPNLNIKVIFNSADYINNSISNVSSSAVTGGLLAVVLVLLFLRNVLSTLVIGISIPVSIIATFAILYWDGMTLNLMTLGGLALGVGMLVDNSIVVLENIYRIREEEGLSPEDSADKGTDEVFAAIIASTLTTLVVFLPLTFMEGMTGLLFRQFALVVSFSLTCSLVTAVMLVPMLAARMIRMESGDKGGKTLTRRIFNLSEGAFRGMENEYRNAIAWCLDHRLVTLVVTAVALGVSCALITKIDVEQIPKTDEGSVIVNLEMETGIRLALMDERTQAIEKLIARNVPELKAMISSVGGNYWRGVATHQSSINLRLGTREERMRAGLRSTEEVANDLRTILEGVPGMTVRVSEGQSFGRGGTGSTEPVAVEVRGHDMKLAQEVAYQVLGILRQINGIADPRITREGQVQEAQLRIDRQKAADLGLWVEDISTFLEICMAGKEAAQYRIAGKEYPIMVRLKNSESLTVDQILSLSVTNSEGRQVSLRNVINVERDQGPTTIDRKNQQRITTVRAALDGKRALGSVMEEVQEAVRAIPLPAGFSLEFGTDYKDQQDMMFDLIFGFILSLVLVYMVMACQFESIRDPFIIMFSVPLAAIGVFITLFLTRTTINMQSMIGCIMLGGIVVNNAIILVDYTNLLRRREGMTVREALEEAGRRRLRPILMTALTTILGLVPLALGWGDGGEAQAPMARAVVGGLLSSTFITLLVVPVVYSLMETRRETAGTTSKRMIVGKDGAYGEPGAGD